MARGKTQEELAQCSTMGRPIQSINEVIRGRRVLTAGTALDFERVLGIEAGLWVRLEGDYWLAPSPDRSFLRLVVGENVSLPTSVLDGREPEGGRVTWGSAGRARDRR